MTAMKVSVIIPAYNAESFIRRTLESVLGQTFARTAPRDIEVVVVDDGSSDRTSVVVEEMVEESRVPIVPMTGPRRGVSAARNEALRQARGDYIAFLDHDDLWEPDKIRRQAELLDEDARAALVFTQARVEQDGVVKELFPVLTDPEVFLAKAYEQLVHWNYIPMSAVMVRRSALPPVPFDPRYKLAEDWDLWLRIAAKTGKGGIRWIPEPLTRYLIVAGRATERMGDLRLEDIEIFREQVRLHPWLADDDRGRCRETLHRLHEEAGYWLLKEGRRAEARRVLSAAWRIKPSSLRPLARLLASLMGGIGSAEAAR